MIFVLSILVLLICGYAADRVALRIGIPGYGSDIPFHWFWSPVYALLLLAAVGALVVGGICVLEFLGPMGRVR